MTSRERRIIHLTLRDNAEVMTTSEGMAPGRHTVIYKAAER
jgi:predicted RNA-binding protein Jag